MVAPTHYVGPMPIEEEPAGLNIEPDTRFGSPATRIALVINHIIGRAGGAERIFVELANMLAARGYEVSCVYFEKRDGKPHYPLDRRVELVNLCPKFSPPHAFPFSLLTSKPFPIEVRNMARWRQNKGPIISLLRDYYRATRPDVAISFLPPANTLALLASVGTAVKVIPTNHNVLTRDYLDPKRWSANPHDRKERLKALRHAAAIHVIFAEFAEWLPPALRKKVVAVPNYVSSEVLRHSPRKEREKVILGVGRLMPVKNYGLLVQAWSKLAPKYPDWRVVIYGEGPQRSQLLEKIKTLGLEDSFELAGSRHDMGSEYARMAILCHPAEFEGFGLVAAEALALEMPVVAFADCPGVNQFVFDGENGLLADRSGGAKSLAETLEKLIVDEELRLRLGGNGPASVEAFTEERFANAWVELIERTKAPANATARH